MKNLLLIDAHSIIHRSFHALPPFTTLTGEPSGALYGLASVLLKLFRENKPAYAAALFDRPEPTFRDAKYAEYKAHRPPTADELASQLRNAHELFRAFGIPTFEKAGYEADDLIATFAEKFSAECGSASGGAGDEDLQVVILTGDRDTLQLVDDARHIVVQTFNKGVSDTTIYDEAAVIAKYGLKPKQVIDYKAIAGDSSDNVKGVPGCGPKTATEVLQKYGSVENIYKHLGDDPKLEKKFGPFKKNAELSLELVTLEKHVPILMPTLQALALPPEEPPLEDYFNKMGFASLMKRLGGGNKESAAAKKEDPANKKQQSMF